MIEEEAVDAVYELLLEVKEFLVDNATTPAGQKLLGKVEMAIDSWEDEDDEDLDEDDEDEDDEDEDDEDEDDEDLDEDDEDLDEDLDENDESWSELD